MSLNRLYLTKIMSEKVQIDTTGIKKILNSFKPEEAISEYIWNGFDAGATEVHLSFEELGGLGALSTLSISDNGSGINHSNLISKFKPFLRSEKQQDEISERHHSLTHGKNGYGRLTFFVFAQTAIWETVYSEGSKKYEYNITVESENLETYQITSNLVECKKKDTGTTVTFKGITEITKEYFLEKVKAHLEIEFGWFIELYKEHNFNIYIDGKALEYSEIVGERDNVTITHTSSNTDFDVSYIRWNKSLKNEYSRYYLIDSKGLEKWKSTTKLNNKGDDFYHSVYIKSQYFDTFEYYPKQDDNQPSLIGHTKNDSSFKYLEEEVTKFLRDKRRPFLEVYVDQKIEEFKKGGVIPMPKDEWEIPKNVELTNVVRGLFVIQPKIFTSATDEQKKIFVRLLDSLLDTSERENILKIIDEILGLDEQDKHDLLELLKTTKLSGIIRAQKLVEDRFVFVNQLRDVVFKPELKANERDHLQQIMDRHFWIFGEEFALVSTTEAKFETAITKYVYLLRGHSKPVKLSHPDKNKEMDLFLCRQNVGTNTIENLIIEIKSPTVKLGVDEVNQLKKYEQVIKSAPECNSPNMSWTFILVGNTFNTSGYIEGEIQNAQNHGEKQKGLIYSVGNSKMYVKTWSQIFTDFECRHKFIQDQLNIDRSKLNKEYSNIETLMSDVLSNKSKVNS